MTDEEMAEEYARENKKIYGSERREFRNAGFMLHD